MRAFVLIVLSISLFACGKDSLDDTGTVVDADGDGFSAADDCDDSDATIKPDADEICDGIDNDCDTEIDEDDAVDVLTWYADSDADSFGDPAVSDIDCEQPSGYVADNTDCDDTEITTYPGADEYCDTVDNDCDTEIDEDDALDVATWYADSDADSFGDPAVSDIDCDQPSGYVADNTDCDDTEITTNPGADEYCDGVNNDCDSETDEDDAVDVATWYADTDADGYGDPSSTDIDCDQPTGFVADNTDCDDTEITTNPGASEVCDNVDNDCDSSTSEDNTARFVDSSGTTTDYSSIGSSSAASTAAPTSAGTLTLCDGTFYMNWDLVDDLDVVSLSGSASDVEIDGAASGAIFVLGDYSGYGSGYSLDLSLADVTLTNGQADANNYQLAGAVSCVEQSLLSSVALDNVIVSANVGASTGAGGVFTYNCDLEIVDSELSGNVSSYGAVYFQSGGDLSITDTVFDANISTFDTSALVVAADGSYSHLLSGVDFYDNDSGFSSYGGSIYLSGGISIDFEDVAVYDNGTTSSSSYATSGVVLDIVDLTWTGSSSQSSGVWSNVDAGSGVYLKSSGSSLISDVADFGGASSNNAEYDIDFSSSNGSAYYAPDDASFVCNNYRCGDDADGDGDASNDEEECTVGNPSSSSSTHYDFYKDIFWGAVHLADSSATLESYDAYMSTTSGCTVDWYLLSSTSTASGSNPTMTWDVEWAKTDQSVSTGSGAWHSSGHIGIPVESGTYYAMAYATSCSSLRNNIGPYLQSSASNQDGGFGQSVGYLIDSNLWGNMNVGGSFSRMTYINSYDFMVRPHVTDLDAPSAGVCP
jgi:hypothetical protein